MTEVIVTEAADGFRFLNRKAKAFDVKAGQTVEVMSVLYAQSLIESGWAYDTAVEQQESFLAQGTDDKSPPPPSEEDILAELEAVRGIGKAVARKLLAAGVTSIYQLIDASPVQLAASMDVTENKVTGWQEAAKQLLEED